jgi:aminoglycoside phosphotransferase family enzyme/predicted kinase
VNGFADGARVHETHSAVVVLVGDLAYKIKKPVDLGFLDFTSLESRHRACLRELNLNRRLSPDVYLDVATLRASNGTPCEYVLVMKRMPEEARLSIRATQGLPLETDLRSVARLVATLHASSEVPARARNAAGAEGLRRRWDDLVNTARREEVIETGTVDQIRELAHTYIEGRRVLLDRRAVGGLVIDGHGDLLADDIFCLPDGPRILDCLDFDERLRTVDVLDDIAFLAMDLERLGRSDAAQCFLRHYFEYSGTTPHPSLLNHYTGYRAFVRATVAATRAGQGDPSAAGEAKQLSDVALRRLQDGEVTLALIGGAPGTGKSTMAPLLADRLGDADILSTDATRREFFAGDPDRYEPSAVARIYSTVIHRARELLRDGRSVVLDATWSSIAHRAAAERVADETASRLLEIECRAPAPIAASRAANRSKLAMDDSEADALVAARLAAARDPWPNAIAVSTDCTPAEAFGAIVTALASPRT